MTHNHSSLLKKSRFDEEAQLFSFFLFILSHLELFVSSLGHGTSLAFVAAVSNEHQRGKELKVGEVECGYSEALCRESSANEMASISFYCMISRLPVLWKLKFNADVTILSKTHTYTIVEREERKLSNSVSPGVVHRVREQRPLTPSEALPSSGRQHGFVYSKCNRQPSYL